MMLVLQRDLAVLTIGGTFDKIYPEGKGIREFTFAEQSAVRGILKRMRLQSVHVVSLRPMDSLDMTGADHEQVALRVTANNREAVVVTHGTDKMIETAGYIDNLKLPKTVVLTGSSQPACVEGSDAPTNFAGAVCAAQHLPHGVYIHMHGNTYIWNQCRKMEDGRFEPC